MKKCEFKFWTQLALSQRCDGLSDCVDASDELNCATCAEGAFHCNTDDVSDLSCILKSQVCNGAYDCPESKIDEQNCESAVAVTCPKGSYYNSGSKDCKKIEHDHCSVQYFPCSQICVEGKDGTSASCECMEGKGK